MKKLLGIILSFSLTLGIAVVSLAADVTTTVQVGGEITAGYLALPGYKPDRLLDITNHNLAYDDGAIYSDLDLGLRIRNDMRIGSGLTAQLLSQLEVYKDDTSKNPISTVADPIRNLNLTYNPGPVKLMFDLKGQEIMMGSIPNEEILKLNVARLYAKDGNNRLHLDSGAQAKQLTAQVPFGQNRVVAVFSLEENPDKETGDFIGAFGEMKISGGKVGLGYRAKNLGYKNPVTSDFYALAFDYKSISGVRLQLDYITRDDKQSGGTDYWQPIDIVDIYPETPFKIRQRLKARLTIDSFLINMHFIDTNANTKTYGDSKKEMWPDNDLAYQVGVSYAFQPYTVGFNYRNWAFDEENIKAEEDGYVAEFYVRHDLSFSTRDYLKVFYRTDDSYGACIVVSLW